MIAQAGFELRLLLRNGEQLLLTLIIPVALLLGITFIGAVPMDAPPGAARLPEALGGVLAVAIIASAFTSLAIALGFDRRSGALLMLATTPLSRLSILGARALASLAMIAVQLVILAGVAAVLGWRPTMSAIMLAPVVVLGTACFAALGYALGGAVRAEATLAIANAAFLVLVVLGGTAFPATALPPPAAHIVSALPSSALGDLLRWCTGDAQPGAASLAVDIALLVGWAMVGVLIARRTFRWR